MIGSEDLLWIVTRNSQSIAASGMRSTSSQPLTSTSAVRLRCKDPKGQRSPDGKHHEELLAEHLRHVSVGQGIVLADVPQVPLETAPCNQHPAAMKLVHAHLKRITRQIANLMTSHWQTAWDNEETGAFYRHLKPDVGYKIKYCTHATSREVNNNHPSSSRHIITNAGL